MSRKNKAPRRIFYPEAKYKSLVLAKFINFVMYDGKKSTSEKIIYKALDKIKDKTKEDLFTEQKKVNKNLKCLEKEVHQKKYQF